MRKTAIVRSKEARTIKENIVKSPYPVVVCGDFNDIPVSYTYHVLSEGLQDAFQESAWGFGKTYAGHIPALKIDNILLDNSLEALHCHIPKIPFSDHYPVVAQFKFK